MTLPTEQARDARAEYERVVQQMLVEARQKRERGEIMPARRMSEGENDYQNYNLGSDWSPW